MGADTTPRPDASAANAPSPFFPLAALGLFLLLAASCAGLLLSARLMEPGGSIWATGGLLAAGAAHFGAVALFSRFPRKQRRATLWIGAIGLRLVALTLPPHDDLWRYLWEGRIQLDARNPYLLPPEAPELAPLRDAAWERINHKDWAAIYPPGAEALFAGIARLSSSPMAFKLLAAAADLAVIALLLRLLTGPGRYRAAAWYAWSPLAIWAFAGGGHFDALMLLASTAALWALHKANPLDTRPPAWRWCALAALFLGLAISLKAIPLLWLPAFALGFRSRAPLLLLSPMIPLAWSFPYGGPETAFGGLADFATRARSGDLVWWMADPLFAAWGLQNTPYNLVAAAAALAATLWFRKNWRDAALAALGAALILSPALHPWYVAWILPLACWRGARPWFYLAATCPTLLLLWEDGPLWQRWQHSPFIWSLVALPPLAAMLFRRTLRSQPAT